MPEHKVLVKLNDCMLLPSSFLEGKTNFPIKINGMRNEIKIVIEHKSVGQEKLRNWFPMYLCSSYFYLSVCCEVV